MMTQITQRRRVYIAGEGTDLVRIREGLIRCVTFLYVDVVDKDTGQSARKASGTAFFMGVPLGETDSSAIYLITARHVLSKSRPYGMLYIRINTTDNDSVDLEVPQDEWIEHPTTDVAAISIKVPPNHDHKFLPFNWVLTKQFVKEEDIGPGDEVFFTSLFTKFPGEKRVQPIVRFGNISLVPDKRVKIEIDPGGTPVYVDAILVESRSLGGQSGSPAFVYFPPDRYGGLLPHGGASQPFWLLGLVHGHFEVDTDIKFTGDILGTGEVSINAGIAIIIPGDAIQEVLMSEELQELRAKQEEDVKRRIKTPKQDANLANDALTKEEFEQALRKVSRPTEDPSDSEKLGT